VRAAEKKSSPLAMLADKRRAQDAALESDDAGAIDAATIQMLKAAVLAHLKKIFVPRTASPMRCAFGSTRRSPEISDAHRTASRKRALSPTTRAWREMRRAHSRRRAKADESIEVDPEVQFADGLRQGLELLAVPLKYLPVSE
jgi:hypothetical protein